MGEKAGKRDFFQKLAKNAESIRKILEDLDQLHLHIPQMEKLFKGYLATFVEDYAIFGKQEMINNKRGSMAMHLFIELSRINFLLTYDQLVLEKRQLLAVKDIEAEKDPNMLMTFSPSACRSEFWKQNDPFEGQPILMYNQEQIIELLLLVSKRMDEMPYEYNVYHDFDMLVRALFTRNGLLMCEACTEHTMNMQNMRIEIDVNGEKQYVPNRDYIMLGTIYFNAVQRRLYYWNKMEHIKEEMTPRAVNLEIVQEWVATDVMNILGAEGYEDLYAKSFEQSFDFVGDVEWFRYRYPARPLAKGPILDCIRPEASRQYFEGTRMSQNLALELSKDHNDTMSGKISRLLVLLAIDQYFKNTYSINWMAAVVIDNSDIEEAQQKLVKCPFPCLLQVLGDYWVYDNGVIYPSNNIYQTFGWWLYLVEKKYRGYFGKTRLRYLTNKLIRNPKKRKRGSTLIPEL